MNYSTVRSACIIGAGVAGLAAARALDKVGVACTIYERRDSIGGVWTDGYLEFSVQVPKALYEFPDFPIGRDVPEFTPGPQIQSYLEKFVDFAGLRNVISLNTEVVKVTPVAGIGGWQVSTRKGGQFNEERYDLVVICVGLYSNIPFLPDIPGQDDFKGKVHHISDLSSPDILRGKRIAVVGYGKSATDAALLAKRYGASTHLVARSLHWPIPRNLVGFLPFKWGLLNRLTLTVVPPYKDPTPLEVKVHSWGAPLVWIYWRVVELLIAVQCGLWSRFGSRVSLVPDEPAEIGAFSEATMVPRPELYRAIRSGKIGFHRGRIIRLTAQGAELDNGEVLDLDCIIYGTGWRSDYSYLPDEVQKRLGFAEDGIYLYRQILHPEVPGLVFVGYASTVSNILAYHMQAMWLAALVAGRHSLPDKSVQLSEIARLAVWKRSWMPQSHARAARLIAHLQHYIDELMTDLGHNPLRKRGPLAPLAEVFSPYQASDYRDISPDGKDLSAPVRE